MSDDDEFIEIHVVPDLEGKDCRATCDGTVIFDGEYPDDGVFPECHGRLVVEVSPEVGKLLEDMGCKEIKVQ